MTQRPVRPAVFFDRDGTLNRDLGYTYRPEDLVWNDGAMDAIAAANSAGWLAIVVTNQSGVGRGLFDEAAMHRFHAHMQADLARASARIDAFYFCPFHPQAISPALRHPNHPDRKPNPGMLVRAIADHAIDPARSLMIGDSAADAAAAHALGLAFLIHTGPDAFADLIAAIHRNSAPE